MVYQIMGILRYHKLDVLSIEMPCLMIQKCFILSLVKHILKTVFSKISTAYLIELIGMVVAVKLLNIQFWLLGHLLSVSALLEKSGGVICHSGI